MEFDELFSASEVGAAPARLWGGSAVEDAGDTGAEQTAGLALFQDTAQRLNPEAAERAWPTSPAATQAAAVTHAEAEAMGFSDEEMDALLAAGVLVDEQRRGPWVPTTPDDVDWIISKRKAIAYEVAERQRLFKEAAAQLARADAALARFDEPCREITLANLPRKKNGDFAAKSLVLPRCKVKITSSKGGPKVVNEEQIVGYLRGDEDLVKPELRDLADAALRVSVTLTYTGQEALDALDRNGERAVVKILHDPIKKHVAALPAVADPVTGESMVQSIPGVVIEPPSDKWSWE
jgi:hypothetical protein